MRYKFGEIAENSKEKRMPTPEDKITYVGLEHLDTKDLEVHHSNYNYAKWLSKGVAV